MAEQEQQQVESGEETEAEEADDEEEEERGGGQKIMCFVSKQMVPINNTVEIEYMPGKKVRVLPKYIKYDSDVAAEA